MMKEKDTNYVENLSALKKKRLNLLTFEKKNERLNIKFDCDNSDDF